MDASFVGVGPKLLFKYILDRLIQLRDIGRTYNVLMLQIQSSTVMEIKSCHENSQTGTMMKSVI